MPDFTKLTERDKQKCFARSGAGSYINDQVDNVAGFVPEFGLVSSKELLLMLSAWLCDPENEKEAKTYFKQLQGD